jgi:AraC-like DNA-binding protein
MDPLSDLVALLRPHAVVSKPIEGRGDWGVRYAAYGQPGFAIVLAGHCWLTVEGKNPVPLRSGDFVLLPATPAFALFSRPGVACRDHAPTDSAVRHGDASGLPDVRMLGGAFKIEAANASLLLALLPDMIHVRAEENPAGRLARIADLIRDECGADWPGRDMILERLLEVVLMECLRLPGLDGAVLPAGLLAGLRDPALAGVLRAIHADVRFGWTVAELAKRAGLSRSVFSARFHAKLGCAPIEYLSRWRMALAQDALIRGDAPLDRLADQIGYESASAFSTAFRRRIGCPPRAFALRHRPARPTTTKERIGVSAT